VLVVSIIGQAVGLSATRRRSTAEQKSTFLEALLFTVDFLIVRRRHEDGSFHTLKVDDACTGGTLKFTVENCLQAIAVEALSYHGKHLEVNLLLTPDTSFNWNSDYQLPWSLTDRVIC
jgi:hypothetical protein